MQDTPQQQQQYANRRAAAYSIILVVLIIVFVATLRTCDGEAVVGTEAEANGGEGHCWEGVEDPFQRCALKALSSVFGPLAEWQRVGYSEGLAAGVKYDTLVWATTYYPEEGYTRQSVTASGYRSSERVCAANAIPRWSFIWTEKTGLRQVLDTGAGFNDRVARKRGAECWVDFWEPRAGSLGIGAEVLQAAVILREDCP